MFEEWILEMFFTAAKDDGLTVWEWALSIDRMVGIDVLDVNGV